MKTLRLYVSRFETLVLYISGILAIVSFGALMFATKSSHGYVWNDYSCIIFLVSITVWLAFMMTQKKEPRP